MAHKEGNVSDKSSGAREANMAVHEFTFFVESVEGPVLASRPINAPNPFKDNTRISFTLTRQSTVSIIIYDMTLRPVRVLVDNEVWDAGRVRWQRRYRVGRNNHRWRRFSSRRLLLSNYGRRRFRARICHSQTRTDALSIPQSAYRELDRCPIPDVDSLLEDIMLMTKHSFRWACKQGPKLLCGLIPLFFLILAVSPVSFAGVDAMPHLRLGAGARSIGMGGAFTAIADDATATVWNPAGLGSAADLSLNFSTQQLDLDRSHNFIALTKALGSARIYRNCCHECRGQWYPAI